MDIVDSDEEDEEDLQEVVQDAELPYELEDDLNDHVDGRHSTTPAKATPLPRAATGRSIAAECRYRWTRRR